MNKKSLGKRSALNAHAAFDEAGGGNMICKINAPLLDPTCENAGVKFLCVTRLAATYNHFTNMKSILLTLLSLIIFITTFSPQRTALYDFVDEV